MLPSVPLRSTPASPGGLAACLVLALLAPAGLLAPPPGPAGHLRAQIPPGVCTTETTPPSVDLASLWEEGARREPGFEAARERVASGGLDRSAMDRERAPAFQVEGLSTYGQRTSPGEERVLGVGPRSELRLLGNWTLLDGSRSWRGQEARYGEEAAVADAQAFARSWQAAVAQVWVEAAASESTATARAHHLARIGELEDPVRRRTRAGVESAWELHLLEEALARAARLLAEAEEVRASRRLELSERMGACVRGPAEVPVGPATEVGGADPFMSGQEDPEIRRLRALAQAREAQARAMASGDRWQLALVGSTGPTRSRAFDPGPVEQEYLVGISGRIGLDLAGVARTRARAGLAQADALRAEAGSLQAARERERARLELEIAQALLRAPGLDDDLLRAEARLEAARLRWEAGVDGWSSVLQAADRALEARLLRTDWALALVRARIRHAELLGSLDALPTHLSEGPEATP